MLQDEQDSKGSDEGSDENDEGYDENDEDKHGEIRWLIYRA